jgi:hypothetical protein
MMFTQRSLEHECFFILYTYWRILGRPDWWIFSTLQYTDFVPHWRQQSNTYDEKNTFQLRLHITVGAANRCRFSDGLKMLAKKEFWSYNAEFSYPASRMTLLSNATGRRGVACTIVKILAKEFTPFFLLAVYWPLEICDSDTLL